MGQRFGKLTVIGPAENIDGRTAWWCRCDCGSEIAAKTCHLRAGKVRSCGCLCGEPRPAARLDGKRERRRGYPEGLKALHYVDGTCVEMLRKNTVRSNNTSGVPGVDWRKKDRRWRASICFKGKRYCLGQYERFEDAVRARKEAEEQTHGAFLRRIDALESARAAETAAAASGK